MLALLLAAVVVPDFSPGRALKVLQRDDETVQACKALHPGALRENTLSLSLLSRNPELVLVEMFDPCVCGAANCPVWIYRVRGPEDERLLSSYAIGVKKVATAGDGVPDVVVTSHNSAAISDQIRYAYRDGKFVETGSWIVRGAERKPTSIPLQFAPGASRARVHGKIAFDWNDAYTLDAAKGQSLEISAVAAGPSIVRLRGAGVDRTLAADRPFVLPASGRYTLDVEVGNDAPVDRDTAYAFTVSIR